VDGTGAKKYGHFIVWPEHPCTMNELREMSEVKDELIEEHYIDILDQRSVDSGHEVFKVLADTSELEEDEWGEYSVCERRWMSDSSIEARIRRFKVDSESFEPSQGRETCDHRLRWNVTSIRYLVKVEIDKVIGRQKKFG
jgi:hypothetical protein